MKTVAGLFVLVMVNLYILSILNRYTDIFKNVNWDVLIGLLILRGIPAIPTILGILGIIWLVGFLFKISRKLDD